MPVDLVRRVAGREISSRRLKKIAQVLLELAERRDVELSLALIGNAEMQKLNARYRHKNYSTDVLSFPGPENLPTRAPVIGDVIISVDKAREQAKQQRHTVDREIVTLLIHGFVHLLGYDHERSAHDARIMARLEKKMVRRLCDLGLLQV